MGAHCPPPAREPPHCRAGPSGRRALAERARPTPRRVRDRGEGGFVAVARCRGRTGARVVHRCSRRSISALDLGARSRRDGPREGGLAMARFSLSALGADRPGIVAAVSGALVDLGCNLEESSMSILHGHFAILLVVVAPAGVGAQDLDAALSGVAERFTLVVAVRPLDEPVETEHGGRDSWTIAVHGADHPGIVHGVTSVLADVGGNVVDLVTWVVGEDSAPVYVMTLRVTLPGEAGRDGATPGARRRRGPRRALLGAARRSRRPLRRVPHLCLSGPSSASPIRCSRRPRRRSEPSTTPPARWRRTSSTPCGPRPPAWAWPLPRSGWADAPSSSTSPGTARRCRAMAPSCCSTPRSSRPRPPSAPARGA